jgi:hypothetical protein
VSFDDIDYTDHKQLRAAQDSMLREQAIRVQALEVVRSALEKCYETQGSNQYENCKDLAERYLDLLPKAEVKGFLGYQRNDATK